MAIKDEIYRSFDSKSTVELQKIWDENDRNEYSIVAFEAIEDILKKRNDTYQKFNSKTIDELQKILTQKESEDYTDVSFEVIEEILEKKNEKIYKTISSKTTDESQKICDEDNRNEYSSSGFDVTKKFINKINENFKLPENKDRLKSTNINVNMEKSNRDFWYFDKMVSTILIKILYIFGIVAITITGLAMFNDSDLIFIGIVIIVLGNLFWRIICENIIIIFKIYDILNQINKKL